MVRASQGQRAMHVLSMCLQLLLMQFLLCAGPLFAALHAADGDQLIQFLFPPERLPAHTQVRTAARGQQQGNQ